VGHTGKDESRGARGSNAHLGDVDVMVQIKGECIKTAEVIKGNDQAEGLLTRFELVSFDLGHDEDGDPITTAILGQDIPEGEVSADAHVSRLPKAAEIALRALREAVTECGATPPASNHIPAGAPKPSERISGGNTHTAWGSALRTKIALNSKRSNALHRPLLPVRTSVFGSLTRGYPTDLLDRERNAMDPQALQETALTYLREAWSVLPKQGEFWSAIAGAIVGGAITFSAQMYALRAGRKQREADHLRSQQALGASMLIKLLRIYSNFAGVHGHLEQSFERAAKHGGQAQPWQFFLPLANPPGPVHFSSDELGMLLAQKNHDVFNRVVVMDVLHNSLNDAVDLLSRERRALTDRLQASHVDGAVVSGELNRKEWLALQPQMIEVNSLIEGLRIQAKEDFEESGVAITRLNDLLRQKLGLAYKLEFKSQEPPPVPTSG
jgi:hypothetical protein